MNIYVDSLGLPGTRQYDGSLDMGDSAAVYFNVEALAPNTIGVNENFYFNEAPVRHPDTSKWWGQPDRYSRDQLIPMLCWAALQNKKDSSLIKKVFWSHLKRGLLLAWNTRKNGAMEAPKKTPDFTLFEIWGLWLRVHKVYWAKPILWILDLETLFGAIHWKYFRKDRVTRNHMLVSITQNKVMPTFISKLTYKLNNWDDLISRWDAHCKAVGEYPTAHLFEKEVK
jgi:hypothetical protein